jgi:D-threo-aldose 1-dehydrogenase
MDVSLPRVGLGTAAIAGLFEAVDEDAALATMERAWERGIRFFDTAPLYGHGLAERRLGQALEGRPRDEYVLATKVGRLLRADAPPDATQQIWEGVPPVNPTFDFTFDGALRSVDESLARLGVERIDVLHVHDPDDHLEEALAGAYRALDRLRSDGAIAAVGAGMNHVGPLVRLARQANFDCFLVAGRYTLLDQTALPELLPVCLDRGIGVIAGGVLNSGILAGGETFDYRPAPRPLLERVRRLEAVCSRHGVPLLAAALQFPLGHPALTSVLIGARSVEELDASLDLLDLSIPEELWAELRAEGLLP